MFQWNKCIFQENKSTQSSPEDVHFYKTNEIFMILTDIKTHFQENVYLESARNKQFQLQSMSNNLDILW